MKKLRLVCVNPGSKSAKEVANKLGTRLGYKVWRSAQPKRRTVNIKYGDMVDKVAQYNWFKQNNIPSFEFTTNTNLAKEWANEGIVFCRTLTRGSNGEGIVIAENSEQVVPSPVYTKYLKKAREFRVHVFRDKVVCVLEKKRRKEYDGERNHMIRNTDNGYVFCRLQDNSIPGIEELAIAASKVTSSDFKGVDIGYNKKKNQLFVIEVNSAPGIDGDTTIGKYVDKILEETTIERR